MTSRTLTKGSLIQALLLLGLVTAPGKQVWAWTWYHTKTTTEATSCCCCPAPGQTGCTFQITIGTYQTVSLACNGSTCVVGSGSGWVECTSPNTGAPCDRRAKRTCTRKWGFSMGLFEGVPRCGGTGDECVTDRSGSFVGCTWGDPTIAYCQ